MMLVDIRSQVLSGVLKEYNKIMIPTHLPYSNYMMLPETHDYLIGDSYPPTLFKLHDVTRNT
jgi:hypothetical protein